MAEMTYLEAIRQALWEEMDQDDRVFLLGEDIGTYGGAFKITQGFLDKFGEDRVIDTPLAESGFVGAAIGAALVGMRPVVEMQFADFISCAFDQIVNMAAKHHYRLGEPVPMVIRAPYGGRLHAGPFHSQCPEAWFIHSPGLKVVAPATPYDAKGLLKASIRDLNPVIYCEHKYLYRHAKGEVPIDDYVLPLGEADIKREGTDIALITYGAMVQQALEAADEMSQQGIEVEVVDLRTLCPLDTDAILASVKKTGKVLIVHEAPQVCGIGAEIAGVIAQEAFRYLDAPVTRLAAPHTPVPFSPPLEDFYLPNATKIAAKLKDLASY
ncbi:MAG: alpha-ketoacid dehydrogenase subunit beta [candidate division NC10 bacterium]|jgi:2-oxoisovalerate dehydrogenase E1 component beta subunit|nr:alpha-ketoacid dehydrogenase subunit beta [candidate division NC10 bacterium]MCH7896205.1 alpha-ketoacid dehydrogenase subunit beta [candidate division NC10 bacterium]MCZ6551031.1 alpha-ketoacid dehydrogenase subunit beta [candidate division NC10 bacterium]